MNQFLFSFLLFLLLSLAVVHAKVLVPSSNLEFVSAQLTPTGFDHSLCQTTIGPLMFGSDDIPFPDYTGMIVLTIGAGQGYVDDLIFKYMEKGAAGVIIMGGTNVYPGDGTQKFRNERTFAYTSDGVETIYPAVNINIGDFDPLFQLFNTTTIASGFLDWVIVAITCEEGDNAWKALGESDIYRTIQVLNGIICLFNIVWSSKILQLIISHRIVRTSIVPVVVVSLNIFSTCIRIIGLVNFENYMQLFDYNAGSFLTSAGVAPLFSACWLLTLMLRENLDKTVSVKLFLTRLKWPFILVSAILLGNDWTCSLIRGLKYKNPYAPLYISIVQIAMTVGLAVALSFIYTIVGVKALVTIKRLQNPTEKVKLFRKSLTVFFIMASMFVGYAISAGITFLLLDDPKLLVRPWVYYTLNLCCVSTCLNYGIYSSIRGRLAKMSSEGKSPTGSNDTGITSTSREMITVA